MTVEPPFRSEGSRDLFAETPHFPAALNSAETASLD